MNPYNPFQKPLSDLNSSDLCKLRETPEGWYIEYKREFPSVLSAAKSLSAFANSNGGWLFYGVEENHDTRTAEAFPGIASEDIPQVEEWLRQAASSSVTPPPYFEHVIIYGPAPEINLPESRAIVVVNIPLGNNSPYIHRSGRIYRRVGDASDPIHETDRYFLDLLWKRGQNRRTDFANFLTQETRLSEAEQSASYLTLYFFTDPWGSRVQSSKIEFKRFASLMMDSSLESGRVSFDNIFTSSDGLLARQVKSNDPYRRGFTWKYYRNCTSEITIPLSSVRLGTGVELRGFLDGYEQAAYFIEQCAAHRLTDGWLIDLSQSYFILCSIMIRLYRLYEIEGLSWPVFLKARISGTWRRTPFLDLPDYAKYIGAYGIPLVQQQECYAPFGTSPDTCLELHESIIAEDVEDASQRTMIARSVDACLILFEIAKALGLHHSATGYDPLDSEEDDWLTKMSVMGDRAISVSKGRSCLL